jgi:hypothetical protein
MGLFKKKTGGTKNRRGGERVIWKKQNDEVVEKRQRAKPFVKILHTRNEKKRKKEMEDELKGKGE